MNRTATARPARADQRGVFSLLRALADSAVDLAHNTVRMAASEGRIVLQRICARLGVLVAGLLIAATGLLLGLAGGAIVLARLAGIEQWMAFVLVGVVTLVAGAAIAARALQRLADSDLAFPATLAEFDADVTAFRSPRSAPEEAKP